MKKNDRMVIKITGLTSEGSGVGRYEGMAVFVPGTASGDEAEIQIVQVRKNFAFGRLISLIAASPDRIQPDCPVFSPCGGCSLRHISYEAECRLKEERVKETLQRIGGVDSPIRPLLPNPSVDGYRNKALYPVGRGAAGELAIGFYAPRSHRIVDCRRCALQPPEFEVLVQAAARWMEASGAQPFDPQTGKGLVRHIYLRKAFGTGQLMACIVANARRLPDEEGLVVRLREAGGESLKSVVLNSNRRRDNVILGDACRTLWGDDTITDTLCGLSFALSPLSFYQVNHDAARLLYEKAAAYASPDGLSVLDLYCGAGTIGLTMAKRAEKIIGVEIVPDAVRDAQKNAALNGIENAEFLCADAAHAADTLALRGVRPEVVVLDPPRKGCDAALIETVADRFSPKRVVYVSCDPATLARDLKAFAGYGYEVREVTPVDLFSRTSHVECVCLLTRQG